MDHIVITGAQGFVGQALARRLLATAWTAAPCNGSP
jgi:nucleoside-diphosphate-sugar epimerase